MNKKYFVPITWQDNKWTLLTTSPNNFSDKKDVVVNPTKVLIPTKDNSGTENQTYHHSSIRRDYDSFKYGPRRKSCIAFCWGKQAYTPIEIIDSFFLPDAEDCNNEKRVDKIILSKGRDSSNEEHEEYYYVYHGRVHFEEVSNG